MSNYRGILKHRVLSNADKGYWGQYQPPGQKIQVWEKLTPEQVFDLLYDTTGSVQSNANKLLRTMAEKKWRLNATLHEGGLGGGGRTPDKSLHITIQVGNASYHVKCFAKPHGLYPYEITA